jgi:acetaldehyde dehydrogenase / alcohol dehydrogenase
MTAEPLADTFELAVEARGVPRGRAMLERAEWASRAFARYDLATVRRIVVAAAEAGAAAAAELAERAVAETGFGVAEHKVLKNLACSTGLLDTYRDHDFVSVRLDPAGKIVEVPRPAGVVLALTPSTNPVATVYFKTMLALMTRNAIVISPHPYAKKVCSDAAATMAKAAVAAGAPDGVVQWVEEPSIPLVNALMTDERTDVIVATGGTAMVRAAYRSGNPAIGVGPGNVPVLVDRTADLQRAAQRIVESKSFDNSILCTNESVLVVEEAVADRLLQHMRHAGAYLLTDDERDRIRDLVFPGGHFDTRLVGKDASWIAEQAGIRVGPKTRVLLAPFDLPVPEEPLAHEKLLPVLGVLRVSSATRGIEAACALLRIGGAGHSAAIHSTDARTILEFGTAVRVLRVSVNVGNSLGSSGLETNLAPSMTIGTGYFGRSSVGENLEPKHLVHWTRLAYNADAREPMADFSGLQPWVTPAGPVPAYPVASNAAGAPALVAPASGGANGAPVAQPRRDPSNARTIEANELREEIRRLIVEELRDIIKG